MHLLFAKQFRKAGKNIAVFVLIFSWIFSGWPIYSLIPQMQAAQVNVSPLIINNKSIHFSHTDDNINENLIIKTDKHTYSGLARESIYFSVTNIATKDEVVNVQAYFPAENGEVNNISHWAKDVTYQVSVPEYATQTYMCEGGWIKDSHRNNNLSCSLFDELGICAQYDYSDVIRGEGVGYYCASSNENRDCDFVNEELMECVVEKVQIASHKETKYREGWKEIELSDNSLEIEGGFWSKLFGNNIERKTIPDNLRVKKSTIGNSRVIKPGETQYFKMDISFLANTSDEFYIEAIGDKDGYGLLDPWWDSSWVYSKQITIDNTKVDADLTNFPVLIDLSSDTSLATYAQENGDDIAFIASNETTQLDHEIEFFNGTTGELQAWVEVPALSSSSDTIIYMYYGNTAASNQENASGVWDSDHKIVHHLQDLTTSTTEDSTSNNNDGTKRVANEPIEASGKIDKAQSFDGTNDYVKITNNFVGTATSLTISSWIKKESGGHTYECALHKGSANTIGSSDYWLGVDINDNLTATIGANAGVGWSAGQTAITATYGEWYHLAAAWDGSIVRVYVNGAYNKQYNLSSYSSLTTPTRFGSSADGTNYQFKGGVDEMRISTSARSASWIKTSYNNQNSPSSFFTLGTEIGLSAPSLHNVPFDNEETPDTTPVFEFTAEDPDGTSDLVYQIEWDDNILFSSPTTRTSDTHSGFINTENGGDTSPFTENERIRFTVQAADVLANSADNTVYYWRVRAKNDGGSFRAWTEINRLRVNSSLAVLRWTQTIDEQFDDGDFVDALTTGSDSVELGLGTDIKSARGVFTTPASTGSDSVIGVGFQPKAVMFFAVPRTDESAGSHASHFVGFSDGTSNKSSSIKSEDGVNDNGRAQQDQAIYLRNIDATNLAVATVSSFDSDGFTLNYTTTNSGYVIHYVAFGGEDLTASVGEHLVSGTPLTGLSFAPELIFLSTTGWITPASDDTNGISSFGVVHDSGYWHLGTHQGSNNTTKDGKLSSGGCLTQAYNNSITWQMINCVLTSDGMSWSGTNTDEFNYLALNIGGQSAKVDTFFKETTGVAGTTQDLSGLGFTDDAAIIGFASAGKTDEAFSDHVRVTMGSYDGTNQGMMTFNDANALTDSDSIQNNDYAIGIAESSASVVAAGTISQLDNDGARITWNPNNTTAYNTGYWAIEKGSGDAASGSITSPTIDYDWASGVYSWGEVSWSDDETSGDIKYQVYYWDGDSWELVPNDDLSGNISGFDTSPVDISDLNTTTYNQIRLKANLTNSGGSPTLQDWSVSWSAPAVSITLNTDGVIDFGLLELNTTRDTSSDDINDIEVISVDNGPADLDVRSSVFTEGENTWALGMDNGTDQVRWDFASTTPITWTNFAVANTLYSLEKSTPESQTRNLILRLQLPTVTASFGQYSGAVTIVASSP
ncbi:DUF2341 domain-containing protein [bacterium]|jgi:hypothetical protein|nr:DUF2341 domain-containing protein [bacterium]MBT4649013.1 DUF2341 domain-containing protein [bacterium]